MADLLKDAYGNKLTISATFSFSCSPAGFYRNQWTAIGRGDQVRTNLSSSPNRGRTAWSVKLTEQIIDVDQDVRAEWAEEGITGDALGCVVVVEIPGSKAPAEEVQAAWEIARKSLADKYGIQPTEIVIVD